MPGGAARRILLIASDVEGSCAMRISRKCTMGLAVAAVAVGAPQAAQAHHSKENCSQRTLVPAVSVLPSVQLEGYRMFDRCPGPRVVVVTRNGARHQIAPPPRRRAR